MNSTDIILPTYNCEKYIEETISSIIMQSFENWKLIIVDDASNDSTLQLIEKYLNDERISLKKLKKNKGQGFCRNLALRYSRSKYVAFIDGDDIWKKDKLKKQIEFMDNSNLDFTYTNFTTFKGVQDIKVLKKINLPKNFTYDIFVKKTSICTSSMIIKRKKIGLTKFLNTKICEDYFFKCQLLKNCKTATNLDENLTLYRISKNSLQSNKFKNLYWVWYINRKYNKMNTLNNILSIISISINSLQKYGLR